MAELEELVKLKEWNDLLHVLSQEQTTGKFWRHTPLTVARHNTKHG